MLKQYAEINSQKEKNIAEKRSDQVMTIGFARDRSRVGIDCGAQREN
jgi:hypothetical protein